MARRLKLDPDLFDGQNHTIHESWPGDSIVIELVEMTDEQIAALPEI